MRSVLGGARLALAAACLVATAVRADPLPPQDALGWLNRIADAARRLSYYGTFVYQQDDIVETSRIAHSVQDGDEVEKLESLDGPRREVLLKGGRLICIYPDTKMFRVDRRRSTRSFPQLLPEQLSAVTDYYNVRKAEVERVAEHDAQALVLEPKDNLRYGHKFWADVNSGLLLKAKMLGERNAVLEQFAFTQVQIGGPVPPEWLRPSVPVPDSDPPADDAQASMSAPSTLVLEGAPAGFRKIVENRRRRDSSSPAVVTHMVLSDGLAAVSVFIAPIRHKKVPEGLIQRGPINVYTRVVGDQRVTVLGEAPAETVMLIANAVTEKAQ
ncbi:MAG: siderophore-interacting protein [Betaproteobacteria bacterium]|nr:siderophore-interacting protein [Betaproteobacteria bacterium]